MIRYSDTPTRRDVGPVVRQARALPGQAGTRQGFISVTGRPVIADRMEWQDGDMLYAEIRIDRARGGKIAESWFMPDRLTVWAQLGLLPPRGTPTR